MNTKPAPLASLKKLGNKISTSLRFVASPNSQKADFITPKAQPSGKISDSTLQQDQNSSKQIDRYLDDYLLALQSSGCSPATKRNYRSDIRQFLDFSKSSNIKNLLIKPKIEAFASHQIKKGLKESSVRRKLASISQFGMWAQRQGVIKTVPEFDLKSVVRNEGFAENDGAEPGINQKTSKSFEVNGNLPGGSVELDKQNMNSKLLDEDQETDSSPTSLLDQYLTDLEEKQVKKSTIRNYKSDVSQFLLFVEESKEAVISKNEIGGLENQKTSVSSEVDGNSLGGISETDNQSENIKLDKQSQETSLQERGLGGNRTPGVEVISLTPNLASPHSSETLPPNSFTNCSVFSQPSLDQLLTALNVARFADYQRKKGLKNTSIRRKLVGITQFGLWAKERGLAPQVDQNWPTHLTAKPDRDSLITRLKSQLALQATPATTPETQTQPKTSSENKLLAKIFAKNKPSKPGLPKFAIQPRYIQERANEIAPYLNLAVLVIFFLGLSYFGYQQFTQTDLSLAFPATPNGPDRILSFQGRLTDTAQSPITTSTNTTFKLYDNVTGGTLLWNSSTCSVDPDQDGIFAVNLGAGSGGGSDDEDCGAEIASSVFSENANVWLQVEVAAETLTPRHPIRSVAYALNSETLQGFPAGTGTSTIPYIDQNGDISIAAASPSLVSTSGTFDIEGQAITIHTSSGSNGDIILAPDGTGGVISQGLIHAPGATLSANYAGGTALVVQGGPSGTANIMEWQNSGGAALGVIDEGGNVGIGTSGPGAKLTVLGGDIVLREDDNGNDALKISSGNYSSTVSMYYSGTETLRLTTDGNSYFNTNGYLGIGTTSPNEALEIGGSGNIRVGGLIANSAVYTDANKTLTSVPPVGGTLGYWTRVAGILSPANVNDGIAATSSATTVATFTQSDTTKLALRAGGSTDATTLNVLGNGNVGIGTTNPTSKLTINGSSTGVTVPMIDLVGVSTDDANAGIHTRITTDASGGKGFNSLLLLDTQDTGEQIGAALKITGVTPSASNFGIQIGIDVSDTDIQDYAMEIGGNSIHGTSLLLDGDGISYLNGGNVGIGTTGPGAKLDILTGLNTFGAVISINTTSLGDNEFIGLGFRGYNSLPTGNPIKSGISHVRNASYGVGDLAFLVDNIADANNVTLSEERMRITKDGNVGIGTTGPAVKLDVVGYSRFQQSGSSPATGTGLEVAYNSGGNITSINRDTSTYQQLLFRGDPIILQEGNTEVMRITDGNVGIGTTGPTVKLDVVGQIRTNINGLFINTGLGYDIAGVYSPSAQVLQLGGQNINDVLLATGYGTAVTIKGSSGNVGIGTTGPAGKLHIYSGASGQSTPWDDADLVIEDDTDAAINLLSPSTRSGYLIFGDEGSATIGQIKYNHPSNYMSFVVNGGEKVRIDSSGNVGIGTTAPGAKLELGLATSDTPGGDGLKLSRATDSTLAFMLRLSATGKDFNIDRENDSDVWSSALTIKRESGNVGIGTTSPQNSLDIGNMGVTSNATNNIRLAGRMVGSNGTFANLKLSNSTDSGSSYFGIAARRESNNYGVSADFTVNNNGAGATPLTAMTLQYDGNIGIGTTNPVQKLQVVSSSSYETIGAIAGRAYQVNSVDYGSFGANSRVGIVGSNYFTGKVNLPTNPLGTQYASAGVVGIGGGTSGSAYGIGVYGFGQAVTNRTGQIVGGKFLANTNGDISNSEALYGVYTVADGTTNTVSSDLVRGIYAAALGEGTDTTYAGFFTASGGGTNYGIYSAAGINYFGGNVGIGTTAPLSLLHLNDASNNRAHQIMFGYSGNNTHSIGRDNSTGKFEFTQLTNNNGFNFIGSAPAANSITFAVNSTQLAVNGDSGNVGIGTSSPLFDLDVIGNASISATLSLGPMLEINAGTCNASSEGKLFYNATENKYYYCDGISWSAVSSGGEDKLVGIDSSAAPGYLGANSTDGVLRTDSTLSYIDGADYITLGVNVGTLDHGGLLGLDDDDHAQYALLAGRSGGQTLIGGTGTTDDLTLQTTSGVGAAGADMHFKVGNNGATEAMTILNNGNVGIGTTGPGAKLHTYQSGAGANSLYLQNKYYSGSTFQNNNLIFGWADTAIANYSARIVGQHNAGVDYSSQLLFQTHNISDSTSMIDAMLIDKQGNVGIGTTSPGGTLDVAGEIRITSDDTFADNVAQIYTDSTNGLVISGHAGTSYDLVIAQGSGSKLISNPVGTNNLALVESSGNVGIGTTGPGAKLDIANGNILVDDNYGYTFGAGNEGIYGNGASHYLKFVTNAGEKVRIDSAGNVGIGTVSPTSQLMVLNGGWADASNPQVLIYGVDNETSVSALTIKDENANTYFDVKSIAGSSVGQIYIAGNVGIGTTGPGAKLEVAGTVNATLTTFTQSVANNAIVIGGSASTTPSYLPGLMWYTPTSNPTKPKAGIWTQQTSSGSFMYLGTSNSYTTGITNQGLTIDPSGNVGIGTTDPDWKLHVLGGFGGADIAKFERTDGAVGFITANVDNGDAQFSFNVDSDNHEYAIGLVDNDGSFRIANNTVVGTNDVFTIDNTGNVGIGTTDPNAQLHLSQTDLSVIKISSSGTASSTVVGRANDSVSFFGDDVDWNGTQWIARGAQSSQLNMTNGILRFYTNDSLTPGGSFSPNLRMTIETTGNVGIGTASPNESLEIGGSGNVRIGGLTASSAVYTDANKTLTTTPPTGGTLGYWTRVASILSPATLNDGIAATSSATTVATFTQSDTTKLALRAGGSTDATTLNVLGNGNVGIGTAGAGASLQVAGTGIWSSVYGFAAGGNAPLAFTTAVLRTANDWRIQDDGHFRINQSGASAFFTIRGTSGNVGIGEGAPGAKLSVSGGMAVGSSYDTTVVADGNAIISGSVGIGTTGPSYKLQVSGGEIALDNNKAIRLYDTGGNARQAFWADASDNLVIQNNTGNNGGPILFNSKTTGGESMRIDISGNVGIGTTSPDTILSVRAPITSLNATNPIITAYSSQEAGNSGGMYSVNDTTAPNGFGLLFKTYKQGVGLYDAIKIQHNGNVGIGTTTPGAFLDINKSAALDQKVVRITSGGGSHDLSIVGNNGNEYARFSETGSTDPGKFELMNSGSTTIQFLANGASYFNTGGNVGIGDTTPDNLFSVGSSSQFQVGSDGDLDKIKNVAYSWPGSQGAANSYLKNNGSGTLTWESSITASSVALSSITAATTSNTINSGDNAQVWNWSLTTAGKTGFTFGENTASVATGTPAILSASTLASSTAIPLYVKNYGAGASFRVDDVASDTTPFIIAADGNVGIGTTDPGAKLDIVSTGSDLLRLENSAGNPMFLAINNTAQVAFDDGYNVTYPRITFDNDNDTGISRAAANELALITGATERVRIDNNGNVGIGTTSPATRLHLGTSTGTLSTGISFGDGDSGIYEGVAEDELVFNTNSVNHWAIKSNGLLQPNIGNGASIPKETATSTNPVFAIRDDLDTGMGWAGANQISLIAGATEIMRLSNATQAVLINGSADIQQLIVQAHSTQTANLTEWQNSSGTVLSGVDERGILFSDGGSGTSNLFIGNNAGTAVAGINNIAIGKDSGDSLEAGATANTLFGNGAGRYITTGDENVAIGTVALDAYPMTGIRNMAIGTASLTENTSGSLNLAIGVNSGLSNTTGSSNIFLGYYSGSRQTTNSNLLIIDNQVRADVATEQTNAILYGVMAATPASQTLRINGAVHMMSGNVGIGTTGPGNRLHIVSSATNTAGLMVTGGSSVGTAAVGSGQILLGDTASAQGRISYENATTANLYIDNSWNNNAGNIYFRTKTSSTAVDAVTILGSGNVGIGTTSPLQKLHVDGQCVTGDTLLLIASNETDFNKTTTSEKEKESSTTTNHKLTSFDQVTNLTNLEEDGDIFQTREVVSSSIREVNSNISAESEINKAQTKLVRIDQIKSGEMIFSLNQQTNIIEPQRIMGLLNMGVKPVFKIVTESGKQITTTGNHPYLVRNYLPQKISAVEKLGFELETGNSILTEETNNPNTTWVKVAGLNKGDQIATIIGEGNDQDISYESIISIEYVGQKQVWDIEVENTHNFVGNGIIAHNTYLNGNVGIGTTTPAYQLQVVSGDAIAGSFDGRVIGSDAVNSTEFVTKSQLDSVSGALPGATEGYTLRGNGLSWQATSNLFVKSDGNVGIGTTGPGDLLVVNKNQNTSTRINVENPNSGASAQANYQAINDISNELQMGILSSGNSPGELVAGEAYVQGNGTSLTLRTTSSNYIRFNPNATEAMRITNNGNVGIGTTSPSQKLHVLGSVKIGEDDSGSDTHSLQLTNNSLGIDKYFEVMSKSGPYLGFNYTGGTDLVAIQYDGNVGIGTTVPTSKLTVAGTQNSSGFNLAFQSNREGLFLTSDGASQAMITGGGEFTGTTVTDALAWTSRSTVSSGMWSLNGQLQFYTNSGLTSGVTFTPTQRMVITTTGNVGIGTTAPSSKLEIYGGANNLNGGIKLFGGNSDGVRLNMYADDGDGYSAIYSYDDNDGGAAAYSKLYLGHSTGAQGIVVDTNGNVGIGTTGPGTKFDVRGYTNSGAGAVGIAVDENVSYGYRRASDSYFIPMIVTSGSDGSRNIIIGNASGDYTNGYTALFAGAAEKLRITSTGNVGIGTTSPTALLHTKAGTTTLAPFKLTSGTNLTTAQTGAFEYDGAELYFTPVGTTRETIAYMSDITGAAHNAVTLAAIGSTPNANAASITAGQVLNLQPANASFGGVVTTGAQTLGGAKTLNALLTTVGISNSTTAISNSAAYTQSGTSANTFTGTSTFSNATYSALFTGGNVGIGTTSPTQKLTVVGSGQFDTIRSDKGTVLVVDSHSLPISTSSSNPTYLLLARSADTYNVSISGTIHGNRTDRPDGGALIDFSFGRYTSSVPTITYNILSGGRTTANEYTPTPVLITYNGTQYYALKFSGNWNSAWINGTGIADLRIYASSSTERNDSLSYIQLRGDIVSGEAAWTNSTSQVSLGEDLSVRRNTTIGGNLTVTGETYLNGTVLEGDSKTMLRYSDSYLRLNEDNDFSSGIWMGASHRLGSTGYLALGSNGGTTNSRLVLYGGTYDGTNYIKIDSSSGTAVSYFNAGNVGIGTTSPTALLHIKAGTTTLAPFKFTSGTNLTTAQTGAFEYDGAELYFTPVGTTRETIAYMSDITGAAHNAVTLAAIGSSPNANAASITAGQVLNLQPANASFGGVVTTVAQTLGGAKTLNALLTTVGISNSTTAISNSAAYTQSGTSANTFTGTSTFSNATYSALFTGGNVGIGTTSPLGKLHVVGNTSLFYGSGNASVGWGNTSAVGYLSYNGSRAIIRSASGSDLSFETNGATEQMRLSTTGGLSLGNSYVGTNPGAGSMIISGNVGIGTTSPSAKLSVYGSSGTFFDVQDDGTSVFTVTDSQITSALPHQFTSAGDVTMAYDLIFTNQTASYIKSYAPLYLEAGESFESNDLTLSTYNAGDIVFDAGDASGDAGTIKFYDSYVKAATDTTPIAFSDSGADINTYRSNFTDETLIGAINETYAAATGASGGIWTDAAGYIYPTDAGNYGGSGMQITDVGGLSLDENLVVDGNVGIGTTSAGTKLEVNGQSRFNSGASYSAIDTGWSSAHGYSTGNWGVRLGATGGVGVIQVAQNTTAYHLSLQPYGGNVGIGTTTVTAKLDIWNGANQLFKVDTNEYAYAKRFVDIDNSTYYIEPAGATSAILAGGVAIGTTSHGSYKLRVEGDTIMNGNIYRTAHEKGFLVGGYNNIGANSTNSNPIFTIGSGYLPTSTTLGGMYGIGYSHTNASFITDPGPDSWGMYVAENGNARIWLAATAGGSSYFNAGNVGIGTTGPDRKLDILDASNPQARLTYTDGSVYSDLQTDSSGYLIVDPTGGRFRANAEHLELNGGAGVHYISDTGSTKTVIRNRTSNSDLALGVNIGGAETEVLFIEGTNGNVGIGTTGPGTKLHVKASSTNGVVTVENSAGTNIFHVWANSANNGMLRLYNSSAIETMRIDSSGANSWLNTSGNVGIGTTGPDAKLNLQLSTSERDSVPAVNINDGYYSYRFGFASPRTSGLDFYGQSSEYYINTGGSEPLHLSQGQNPKLTIKNGNVGIGTTNPGATLDVQGNSLVTGNTYIGTSDSYFYRDTANRIATPDDFYVQGSSSNTYLYSTNTYLGSTNGDNIRVRDNELYGDDWIINYNEAGNWGIGTTTPSQNLTIRDTSSTYSEPDIGFEGSIGSAGTTYFTGKIYTKFDGASGTTARMTLASRDNSDYIDTLSLKNGNVGIGTTSPSNKLHIYSTTNADGISIDGTASPAINLRNSGTAKAYIALPTGAGSFSSDSIANDLVIRTQGTSQRILFNVNGGGASMMALNNGNVGIGTTAPTAKLHVYDSGNVFTASETQIESYVPHAFSAAGDVSIAYDLVFTNQTSSLIESYGPLTIRSGESFENNNLTLKTYGTGDIVASMGGTSSAFLPGIDDSHDLGSSSYRWDDVYATNGTIQTSDVRLKENIANLDYGIDEVMRLRPVSFTWIGKPGKGTRVGLIAQETLPIIPEIVDKGSDNGLMGINYSNLTPVLIKAIQEQQLVISQNQTSILALTSDQSRLFNQLTAYITNAANQITTSAVNAQSVVAQSITIQGLSLRDYISQVITQMVESGQFPTATQSTKLAQIETDLISPLADDLTVSLASPSSKLTVIDGQNKELASIDNQGNLTISGTSKLGELVAQDASISGTTKLGQLLVNDATVSGKLEAKEINATSARVAYLESQAVNAQQIQAETAQIVEGHLDKAYVEQAQIADAVINNATVSGTLHASNLIADQIANLEEKIAQALSQPSLLSAIFSPSSSFDPMENFDLEASTSADLNLTLAELSTTANDVVISPHAAYINEYLKVNGNGYIASNLGVGKQITIGDGMMIAAGALQYSPTQEGADRTLHIQPSGTGTLSLMAGLMTLTEQGQVIVSGNLAVAGDTSIEGSLEVGGPLATQDSLLTNLIQPLDMDAPIQLQLAETDPTTGQVNRTKFEIINESGTPVATISASGKAQFSGGLGVDGENVVEATDSGLLVAKKTAGKSTLKALRTEVTIKSELINENTLIYVTPLGSTGNKVLYVKSQVPEDPTSLSKEGRFTVGLDSAINNDVEFNWWLVN